MATVAIWSANSFKPGPTCDASPDELVRAAALGRVGDVRSLAASRHDINVRDTYGQIALYCAVEDGNTEMTGTLLDLGADASLAQHFDGWPVWDRPLIKAIDDRRDKIPYLLLDHGADPNGSSRDRSALGLAIDHDDLELATALLDHGAKTDQTDLGNTPLNMAAWKSDSRFANLLLDRGAAVDVHGRSNGLCLTFARASAGAPDCGLPLAGAAETGNVDLVRRLLDRGANPTSGLYSAGQGNHPAVVRELLERGADPNGEHGTTPLAYATLFGNNEIVGLLLDHGADPNRGGPADAETLQVGMAFGLSELPDAQRPQLTALVCGVHGSTTNLPPLVIAAAMGHIEITRMLLTKGADQTQVAAFDRPISAIDAATAAGHDDIVVLLGGPSGPVPSTTAPPATTARPTIGTTWPSPCQ